jgi:hypothetical protein
MMTVLISAGVLLVVGVPSGLVPASRAANWTRLRRYVKRIAKEVDYDQFKHIAID